MPIWAFQKRIIGNPTPEKAAFVSSFADCDELFVINQRFPNSDSVIFRTSSFSNSRIVCPDCGAIEYNDHAAVRQATDAEVKELLRIRAEDND